MTKNTIVIFVIAVIVIGAGSFYGGMKYSQSKSLAGGGFANLTADQRSVRFQQMATADVGGQRGVRAGGGSVAGEIVSKDAGSITVKLNDGGSKIALFSTSTQVMSSSVGSLDDLVVGENVMVSGQANQDGSITAQSVQIRPQSLTSK